MLEYIYKDNAVLTDKADPVEKLKLIMHDRRQRVNPFVGLRAVPIAEEGGTNGGKVRFSTILGLAEATRRGSEPTGNTYEFGNQLRTKEIVLTIDQPLETPEGKLIPTSRSDVEQQDGIDIWTPMAASKTINILVDGETRTDVDAITTNALARVITYDDAAVDKFTQMRYAVHRAIAAYYDISEANAENWTNADVFKYFDADSYSYTPEEIHIYANPADVAEMSLELLSNGVSNGDGVYQEAIQGKVPMIAGRPINQSRYVPKGEVWVSPLGMIGAPTQGVMYTYIKTSETAKGDLGTYGKHYYDSLLVAPELFTRVVAASAVEVLKTKFAKTGVVFKDANVINIEMPKAERIEVLQGEIDTLKAELETATDKTKAKLEDLIKEKEEIIKELSK